MNDEDPSAKERLEKVLESVPCAVAGCWPLHGGHLEYYFDSDAESHVLEVWPIGFEEPAGHGGNGHHRTEKGLLYELAEFDFLHIAEEIPVEHFHFSQQHALFEIGWSEGGNNLELRIHILPRESGQD
jgi:hypothetical protein